MIRQVKVYNEALDAHSEVPESSLPTWRGMGWVIDDPDYHPDEQPILMDAEQAKDLLDASVSPDPDTSIDETPVEDSEEDDVPSTDENQE